MQGPIVNDFAVRFELLKFESNFLGTLERLVAFEEWLHSTHTVRKYKIFKFIKFHDMLFF